MKNKKPQIFSINNQDNQIKNLLEIQQLLIEGKFKKVIKEAAISRQKFPNIYFYYTMGSIALSFEGRDREALKLINKAAKKFPDEYEVQYQLAKILEENNEYSKAEQAFKKSYELTPVEYNDARADCLNDLGVLYWGLRRRDEALEQWRLALIEYPTHTNANNNYRDFSNVYDEPTSVSELMDDVFHFQKIQMDNYFKIKKKDSFSNEEEANRILSIISEKWNSTIAPDKEKLDKLTPLQKTNWFKSVHIDYEKEPEKKLPFETEDLTTQDDDLFSAVDDENSSIYDHFDESEILLVPFSTPLLYAIGIKEKRIDAILSKEETANDYELDMIFWAVDVCGCVFDAIDSDDPEDKDDLLNEAMEIALEELNKRNAKIAIEQIESLFKIYNNEINN